jgi:mannose-1-phosphate guanylyltransferase
MSKYKVLLLAAGEGTRLRPLTENKPKCLVEILGKPLLYYWFELFQRGPTPSEIYVNTSYLFRQVENFINDNRLIFKKLKINIIYEPKLCGTAGTIKNLLKQINDDQKLIIAHADNLTWFNLNDFLERHEKNKLFKKITMMTFKSDDPANCGIVKTDEELNLIEYYEKNKNPISDLANGAVFIISPEAFDLIKSFKYATDFCGEVVPEIINKINTWENSVYHRDIGTFHNYEKAKIEFQLIKNKYNI